MYLSKRYLNEQAQKGMLKESYNFSEQKRLVDAHFSVQKEYDIFLSYSLPDQRFAKLIYQKLTELKFVVYADFLDNKLSRENITKETAQVLAGTISNCKSLIYVHSRSAKDSKWCPWEVGLASGLKNFRCGILPLIEEIDSEYDRQEYLTLYPEITYEPTQSSGERIFWAQEDEKNYSTLKSWVNDGKINVH